MATAATEAALVHAQLLHDPLLSDGGTHIAYGASTGSTDPLVSFARLKSEHIMHG